MTELRSSSTRGANFEKDYKKPSFRMAFLLATEVPSQEIMNSILNAYMQELQYTSLDGIILPVLLR